jgi:hypothetical protein
MDQAREDAASMASHRTGYTSTTFEFPAIDPASIDIPTIPAVDISQPGGGSENEWVLAAYLAPAVVGGENFDFLH